MLLKRAFIVNLGGTADIDLSHIVFDMGQFLFYPKGDGRHESRSAGQTMVQRTVESSAHKKHKYYDIE